MADVVIDAMIAEAARLEKYVHHVPLIFVEFLIFLTHLILFVIRKRYTLTIGSTRLSLNNRLDMDSFCPFFLLISMSII